MLAILTIVAAFLAVLLIGAVAFTMVGLHRRKVARQEAERNGRGPAAES